MVRSNATTDTWKVLWDFARKTPVVDAHTHVQDDLPAFDRARSEGNLEGTQNPVNRASPDVVEQAILAGRLTRRTMLDAPHGLFYSWFAALAEGSGGRLDEAIARCGSNTRAERREAGRLLLRELHDSRYTEYADWLRAMYREYPGCPQDPLDPRSFDAVCDAVAARRHDPDFARDLLESHGIRAYVTSIENRADSPPRPPVHPGDIDLAYALHPEAWSMFDCQPLIWPEGATDSGLFLQGHRFQAERYLLHLEEYFQCRIGSVRELRDAVEGFFRTIIRSPRTNPSSRILYVNGYQGEDWRFSGAYSASAVDHAIRHHKEQLDGSLRRQVIACVAEAMLGALDDIGREYREQGGRFGCCLQMAGGAAHFLDWTRQVQSFPSPIPRLAQEEYPVWTRYRNVHFEYICAHEGLYRDLAGAAKQVPNVSVGPWWHLFRRASIARLVSEQLSLGPVSAIACGFTDARFVEMIGAKYTSLRRGVVDALAAVVDDEASILYRRHEEAAGLIRELLYTNPAAVHHIPGVETARATE